MKQKQRRAAKAHEQASENQIEQRRRRRTQLPVVYTGEFDLLAEVHDILTPLADRIAAESKPLIYRPYIESIADAVHALTVKVAEHVAAVDARRAAAHLPIERRGRAVKLLRELAMRPPAPRVIDSEIASGAWPIPLSRHCSTYSGRLSDSLSLAAPPDTLRGAPTLSEMLLESLRVVDQAIIDAAGQLDKAAFFRHEFAYRAAGTRGSEPVHSELAALGISR